MNKQAACLFRRQSRSDARERRTNKLSSSIKSKPTCRWMTRYFISPAKSVSPNHNAELSQNRISTSMNFVRNAVEVRCLLASLFLCAIALDPKNSKNVWVGTGESWTRNSVSIGDGIYKSTDGGESWSRAGLEKSERVARITVDPRNSDTVFVAVPGALWSDSPDRGLYKTTDDGKTWQQVLKGANLSTGCAEVKIDPTNPDIMFAAMWDFRRKGWEYRSGGDSPTAPSASGLFRSIDGGNTWTEITPEANKGFPKKPNGRLAIAIDT